jgi:iron complex outermembrane receptor protein
LRLNGAAFYSEYEDIQLSALTSVGGQLLPNTLNAAPAEIVGVELEMIGRFGGLGFNVGLSALDHEFTKDAMLTNSLTNQNELVPAGSPIPFAPELTITAGLEYEFLIGSSTLTPRVQLSYMDEQLSTPFSHEQTIVPSRTIADVRLTWVPISQLRIEGFVSNVLDKEYIAAQVQNASSADGGIIFGAPRQYGIRAKYDF